MDNALKAISSTPDELRVANYIVLFGGRDLEGIATPRRNRDGSIGEYFAPDTALDSPATKAGRLPVDWEHRNAPEGEDPGRLGFVDWATAKADSVGVWVERVLSRSNRYVQMLESLIAAGIVGTSTEADPAGVEKADDGRIMRWPLVADTLTVTPMEPRMLTENVLQAAKALGLLTEQPTPEAKPEAVTTDGGAAVKATDNQSILSTETEDTMAENEVVTLTPEALKALVTDAIGEAEKAWTARQPVDRGGFVVEDELDRRAKDPELQPYKHLGEQLVDVVAASYRGNKPTPRLLKAHKAIAGASEQVPADGGFLVQTDIAVN